MDCLKKVYAIIVTHNAMKWIDKCLTSLDKSEEKVTPIVVDNCSCDETVDYIRKSFPSIAIISNKKNKGFGYANNQGIEYAYTQGASHFLLLNQDAWVKPDTVGKLLDVQEKNDIDIVSPIHINGDEKTIDPPFFKYTVIRENNYRLCSDLLFNNLNDYYCVNYVNAAAWMLSKRCVDLLGGFDPIFFIYGEDVNYCQRLLYHNMKLAIVPSAIVVHDRILWGSEQTYNKYGPLSLRLTMHANINEPFIRVSKDRIIFHYGMIKRIVSGLVHGDFKKSSYYIIALGKYITMIPSVIKSRIINKRTGRHYLFVENEKNVVY